MLKDHYFRAIFVLLAAFAVLMALIPKPPQVPLDNLGDKFQHIMAFAVLTLFARLGFSQARELTILERMSFLGAAIEVLQSIPMLHRDCDWRDWMADTLAVAVTLLITRLLPLRKASPASAE